MKKKQTTTNWTDEIETVGAERLLLFLFACTAMVAMKVKVTICTHLRVVLQPSQLNKVISCSQQCFPYHYIKGALPKSTPYNFYIEPDHNRSHMSLPLLWNYTFY